ncbi:tryptophan--tRNA ligase [Sedimentisphaera salicampi]|uniref:Tryptophan--tRNA ligase n=1 Tax=Sedimentisphaera salicampi TaxID=1941349 RepID=A0A1W6LJ61_9BACT|nr:tryptophan--tRNA ligase [Sedimentisphaera salicampi]ARN55799.1 Tryptophan--tRNA ligase [Sedimentisphaera salicampi]OXU15992.1 Tryptophan--tRNA ligase [Sedimentisphaera salicampi]
MKILSGIQPSGRLHIGNYFGAMKQHLQLQDANDGFYFIAEYHALTSNPEPDTLRDYVFAVAADYLALGLNPEKTVFWRQTDVPEVVELMWLLSCVTPVGLMERCVSYKDKLAKGLSANHGLFTYPLLQAADILAFESDLVPVGADQKQHIEVTCDIAQKFNHLYGETFKIPKEYIIDSVAVVPGIDGQKMSKSYDNTIEIFEPEKKMRKKVMKIKTDSAGVDEPKNPDTCSVFALLKLFASEDELKEWDKKYREGGMGYGDAKKRLAELMLEFFKPYREKREELDKDPAYIEKVLKGGAERARAAAGETLARARHNIGIR